MSAQLIGTTGVWAIPSAESGILIESLDFDFKSKEKECMDNQATTIGLVLYNPTTDIAIKGLIASGSLTGVGLWTIGSVVTIANTIPANSWVTGGKIIVKGVKRGFNQEDWSKFDGSATQYPGIPTS